MIDLDELQRKATAPEGEPDGPRSWRDKCGCGWDSGIHLASPCELHAPVDDETLAALIRVVRAAGDVADARSNAWGSGAMGQLQRALEPFGIGQP